MRPATPEFQNWTERLSRAAQIEATEALQRREWPEVEAFRSRWLNEGRPFETTREGLAAARNWLEEMAKAERSLNREAQSETFHFQFDDDGDGQFAVRAPNSRFFAEADRLARMISGDRGWGLPSVRAWLVVRDGKPVVESMRLISFEQYPSGRAHVVVEIPLDVPPSEVGRIYAGLRSFFATERDLDLPLQRAMKPAQLSLAAFIASRNDGRRWASVYEEWQARMPIRLKDWSFKSPKQLSTLGRKAYKQLTGRALSWKGPKGRAEDLGGGD